jgi:Flp pilus assembly protein TadD
LREEGARAYKARDFAAAQDLFSRALERDPQDARHWTNRAAARVEGGDFVGAVEDCDRAIQILNLAAGGDRALLAKSLSIFSR